VVDLGRPLPAGTVVYLRFDAANGHSGGGLLSGAVQAQTASVPAGLAEWEQFGLGSFGGYVSYRRPLEAGQIGTGESVTLDLGDVRGSAEVRVNDGPAATVTWSPYRPISPAI
jgi:hypothetical protein